MVIPGEEVKTEDQGEVIGLFLTEEIPRGQSFGETVAAIRAQGGIVYLPHPFDRLHAIPEPVTLHRHLAEVDVLEVYNARLLFEAYNDEALRFARKYDLAHGRRIRRARPPGSGHGGGSDARVRGPRGLPRQPAHGPGAAPAALAALPPVAQVGGAGQGKSALGENRVLPLMPAVTDEIFEKYLQKAIAEINDLGDEIGRAAGEGRVPVLGSGHPLADVFLLKHEPQPAEVQEGVAFYGRAGQAVLKSLQRLHVDPMAIYGTNALKFAGGDPEEAQPWLARELHIVQPKLVVVMGEPALAFLNQLEFPLADALEPTLGELQRFTPTIQALHVPDIDESLDEQPAKTKFWNAFKTLGPWWAELPPY